MILSDGSMYDDQFVKCVSAPGYRGIGLEILVHKGTSRETIFLRLNKRESLSLAQAIKEVHEVAWRRGRPSDFQQGEEKPDWIS